MLVPAQIAPVGLTAIVTLGTNTGLTVITIAVLVAVSGAAHKALLVITTS